MTASAVEAAIVPVPRRLIAVGRKQGSGSFVMQYPPKAQADKDAHAAASCVRQRPVALTDEERDELSKKLAEVNKRSSQR
ncbi:hypothetical protein EAO70_06050 [Streptomyces sp. adm13(2018)]|uniref:hypothetical protein n=1 Tax=Streptomyces sp. adm13(2018) TaxID=2479007 RepID=UPI0011CEC6D2|nr:hypothetical protein [Streptomyces sp. adm13(2018)]TXS22421.1 hypothetical protein EAO70_06050 [Streptomyces sp. adm13(2018)]